MESEAHAALNDWEHYDPLARPAQILWRAHQLASSGHRKQALNMINQWLASDPRASSPPLALAAALLAAGENSRALDAIRQSVERHVASMVWVKSTPELSSIRSDPRFIAAVSLMKPD
jgi:hypothetical protein